jgi:metal-sulfur cluster biosynthetic enzyme
MTIEPREPTPSTACDEEAIRNLLREVVDPEVGVNIVDLGLVYRIAAARVEMTMTSPACPMGEMIVDEARAALAAGLGDRAVPDVVLVWQPPWDPSMMSQSAKQNLGWAED